MKRRHGLSDSVVDSHDTTFREKGITDRSAFDQHKAVPSQQKLNVLPKLDMQRAESSRQHVRALNTQFASWVQTQLKNHPDELWEDGVRDYLSHASSIMEKFSDVVNWLKANAVNGAPASASLLPEKKSTAEVDNEKDEKVQAKPIFGQVTVNSSSTSSWSSSMFSSNQSSGGLFSSTQSSGLFSSSQSSGPFSSTQSSSLFSNTQGSGFKFNSPSSGSLSNSKTSGLFSISQSTGTGLATESKSSGFFSSSPSFGGFSTSQSSGLSNNNQNSGSLFSSPTSGALSDNQSFGLLTNNQTTPLFGGQSIVPSNNNTTNDAGDEDEPELPSSPSVKKTEEKGVVAVHEVKCKLYVKSTDPGDKDTWKDKGTGQLSIKCKEGVSKGTKESKPTIIVRNDVGKVLLNALLYQGIKTNAQKNSLVAIFHTADDNGSDNTAVARTFLIRLKTEEDRNKLAAAMQEYAPTS